MGLDDDVKAVADNGGTFQSKLADSLRGLISANNERKSEIESLRGDHETLRKDHDAFQNSAERENDLRRNEIKSLEEKMLKENQVSCHYGNTGYEVFRTWIQNPRMKVFKENLSIF